MHYKIKKTFLAAALTAFTLSSAFPAFADEPVGKDVTVVTTADTSSQNVSDALSQDTADTPSQDTADTSSQDTDDTSSQDTSGGQDTGRNRTGASSGETYTQEGPGVEKKEKEEEAPEPEEISLGQFKVTGYCGCQQCSKGHNLTYSGTVPTPGHTISADLNYFPIGTRLQIDGTVYTVEDKGSSVNGNILDIYYGSHQEALAKGTYTAEVFLIQD